MLTVVWFRMLTMKFFLSFFLYRDSISLVKQLIVISLKIDVKKGPGE